MVSQLQLLVLCSKGMCTVLDDLRSEAKLIKANLLDAGNTVKVDWCAAPMHEQDDLRRRRQLGLEVVEVHAACRRVYIDPLDTQPIGKHRPVGSGACERARKNLVDVLHQPWPRAIRLGEKMEGQVESRGRRVESQHARVAEEATEHLLEVLDLGALRDEARVEHIEHRRVELRRRRHEDFEERDGAGHALPSREAQPRRRGR